MPRLLSVAMATSLLWLLACCASDGTQQKEGGGEQPNHPQQGGVREEILHSQEQHIIVFEETTHVEPQEAESKETPRSEQQGGMGEVPNHKLTACGSGESQQQADPNGELHGKIAFASQIYASTSPNVSASVSAGENASVASAGSAGPDVVRGHYDLCLMYADGTDLTRITNTSEDESSPLWSPDGDKLAFLGPPGGINVANADGSNQTQLSWSGSGMPGASYTGNRAWAWSPDGRTFAYTSGCDMYIAPADGSGTLRKFTIGRPVRVLDPTPHHNCFQSPAWSPNGKQIAFTNVTQEGNDGLYIMNVSHKVERHQSTKLTNDPAAGLAWSPDGSEIAFVRAGSYSTQIYKIDVNSLEETPLTEGVWPTWSPEGDKIAFVGKGGINVMDADGSNPTTVFEAAGVSVAEPVWQPLP